MAGIFYSSEYLDVEEIIIFSKLFLGVLTSPFQDLTEVPYPKIYNTFVIKSSNPTIYNVNLLHKY